MADSEFGSLVWDMETQNTAAHAAAGEEAGGKAGWLEGADLGVVKGAQIGAEVGQYQGFAEAVQELALGNARAQAQAERLLSTTARIVLQDAQDETWYAAIEQARAQYKALTAMVHMGSTAPHAAEDLSF